MKAITVTAATTVMGAERGGTYLFREEEARLQVH